MNEDEPIDRAPWWLVIAGCAGVVATVGALAMAFVFATAGV